MKALIEKDVFEQGYNRYYARFPLQLMIISMAVAIIYKFGKGMLVEKLSNDVLIPSSLSGGFYYGVLISVGLFYLTKFVSTRALKNAWGLEEMADEGYFVPCVMGANMPNSKMGNLMIRNGEFYFQPDRQYKDVYDFKVPVDADLAIGIVPVGSRILTKLLLGEKQVMLIQDKSTGKKYTFIVPNPETVALELKKVLG